jgi:signal transduction histidine kinase
MDILNIDNLLYLVTNIFRIYVLFRFVGIFFKREYTSGKIEMTAFIAYYIINSSAYLFFANVFINLASNLLLFFVLTFIYRSRLSTKLISTFLIYAVNLIFEGMIYNVIFFSKLALDMEAVTGILSNILLFLFVLTIEKFHKRKMDYDIKNMHWFLLFLIPLGSIYITIVLFLSNYGSIMNVIAVGFLLGINVMVFYFYDMLGKYYSGKSEINLLSQQNKAYTYQFELIRESQKSIGILKHDLKNHISTMKNMVENNKYQDLLVYLSRTYEYVDIKSEYAKTGNVDVDSILNYKIKEAERVGALIELDINIPDKLKIEAFDMNVILGNLLDNAVEAVKKINEKKIKIEMELDRGCLYIKIENTFNGNIEIRDGKLKTIKNNSQYHGIGLVSIKNALDKYEGIIDIDYQSKTFSVNIMLYNNERKHS